MKIIVFSNGWGHKYGGINSFNYAFCNALINYIFKQIKDKQQIADGPNKETEWQPQNVSQAEKGHQSTVEKVVSDIMIDIVTCGISDTDRKGIDAENYVKIHNVSESDLENPDKICNLLDLVELDKYTDEQVFFVGHDIITGKLANDCAKKIRGKSIVFHHMAYNQYYSLICDSEDKVNKKLILQKDVILNADIVIGVGPKLANSAKEIISNNGGHGTFVKMIPGFDSEEIISNVVSQQFKMFFSGRIEYSSEKNNNNVIKQYDCVVKTFYHLIENKTIPPDSMLYLCGIDDKDGKAREHFEGLKNDITKKTAHIEYHSYMKHEDLLSLLRSSSVAIMPSFDEGFGLTGLEAITSNVPVVISQNSGLYQALFEVGLAKCVLSMEVTGDEKEDIKAMSACIQEVFNDPKGCRAQIEVLRNTLTAQKKCTWHDVIERFIKLLSAHKYVKKTAADFEEALISLCFPHLIGAN